MKLTVKPIKGGNFEVEAEEQATVETLKKIIAEAKPDFPADLQKLIYSGRILKDEDVVGQIGVKAGEFIVVMAAKAKAPAAPAAPAATPSPAAETPSAPPAAAEAGGATPAGGDATAAAAANLVTGAGMESTITQLMEMGFEREQVEKCLVAAFNNPDRAVEYLMSGIPEDIQQEMAAPPAPAPGAGGGPGGAPPVAPAAGGGGAAPFPSMAGAGGGGGGGGGGAGVAIPPQLAELRNNPQFAQLAGMLAQNPQMMAQMLPALAQSNPELVQVIQENPQAFMQLIQEAAGGGGGGGAGGGQGPTVIQLTEDERAAVDRLTALGFDRNMAAQAYLACDKNEELAANFLFDSGNDMGD